MLLLLLLTLNQGDLANLNWAQAADELSTELANLDSKTLSEAGFQSYSEVMTRFAAVRSTTVNTARRQLAAVAFLKNVLEPTEFKDVVERRCPPFNDVEYLKKIYDIDQVEANNLMKAVLDRTISRAKLALTYTEIQERTPNQRQRIAVRRGTANDFQGQIIEALKKSTSTLYPKTSNVKHTRILEFPRQLQDFSFALPDAAIELLENNETRIDGIEIRMPGEGAKHEIWQILERIHLMSTFFNQTWLFLPSPVTAEQKDFIQKLSLAAKDLDMPSVGIVTCAVGQDLVFEVLIHPTGLPDIDRRYLFPLGSEYTKYQESTPAERAKRIRRDASRRRGAAPEATPAPAG